MTKNTLKKQILTAAVLVAVMGVSAVASAEYNWRDYSSEDMKLGDNPIVGNSDPSEIFTKEISNIKTPGPYTHATTETGVIGATGIDLEFKRDASTPILLILLPPKQSLLSILVTGRLQMIIHLIVMAQVMLLLLPIRNPRRAFLTRPNLPLRCS